MTHTPDTTAPPGLESWLARIGIFAVSGLSAWMGYQFWDGRGETLNACLTLACEFIALGGFAVALHHIEHDWRLAAGAGIVTALAAGWCGLTMVEKLNAEAHERAVEAAIEQPAYRQAAEQLSLVTEEYQRTLRERAPEEIGPLGRAAWAQAQRELLALLADQVEDAQKRLDELTPPATISALALLRGFGINLACLIGLAVFGLPRPTRAEYAQVQAPAPAEATGEVIDLAAQRRQHAAAMGRRSGEVRREKAKARKG